MIIIPLFKLTISNKKINKNYKFLMMKVKLFKTFILKA